MEVRHGTEDLQVNSFSTDDEVVIAACQRQLKQSMNDGYMTESEYGKSLDELRKNVRAGEYKKLKARTEQIIAKKKRGK